jgi:beta-glucosidase
VAKNIEDGNGWFVQYQIGSKNKRSSKDSHEKSRLKIPLIFAMDVIHGYETTFPIPLGLSVLGI